MSEHVELDDDQIGQVLVRVARAVEPLEIEELRHMSAMAVAARPTASDGPYRRTRGRRSLAVLGIAAVILMVATAATAVVLTEDSPVPDGLQGEIMNLFAGRACVGASEATGMVQDRLSELGVSDWTVVPRPGASGTRCVIPGLLPEQQQVVLLPVQAPAVVDAMHAMSDRLMSECLSEEEARAYVGSVMGGLGITDWTISTDGPLAIPGGQQGDVRAHLAAGCALVNSFGQSADGTQLLIFLTPPT